MLRKTVPVLALIAFARDFSPRDVLVHGDPARKPDAAARSDGYQTNLQFDVRNVEAPRRSVEDRGRSNEPVGKWRSNGEAVEPKWRDGDSVPLLPFSHYSRSYSRDDEADEDYPATSRRPFKYRYSVDQANRDGPARRNVPLARDDYDYDYVTYRNRDTLDDLEHDYPRERRRPLKSRPRDSGTSTTYDDETIESAASSDGRRGGRNVLVDASSNEQEASSRYREAFQAHGNEYEHEFNDEEYLRPRPRKRRPPQNYEFALAHAEASADEPPSSTVQPADNNALELKMLLKMQQEEGSSLSEILQRRNLTLSDLLEGKADVIDALKSKIADSEEYIEEMSRVMSNSLMKLAATATPPFTTEFARTFAISESTTAAVVASSTILDNSISASATSASSEAVTTSMSRGEISSNDTTAREKELRDTEKPTTSAIVSTVITTTSTTSSPIALNSMEYFLNDDGNAESTSDQRGATRLENLDEDEIMEFSDFMDFKKGKNNQATPILLNVPNEKVAMQRTSPREVVSTLSIEHILHPTERIKLMETSQNHRDEHTIESGKEAVQSNARSAAVLDDGTSGAEDYNAFIEAEYQNDAPVEIPEEARRQNTNKTAALTIEKQRIANPADDRRRSYNKNHSTEYHQVNQSTVERTHALENHRNVNSKRYEEVISEIEPEARAEIFELFASGSAGRRLERLLKSRNMSVEELIALRQRGSSKAHLTEVSRRLQQPKSFNDKQIVVSSAASDSNDGLQRLNKAGKNSGKEEEKNQFRQDIVSYLHDPWFDRDSENTSLSKLLDLAERDRNAASRKLAVQKEDRTATWSANNKHTEQETPRRTGDTADLLKIFGSLAEDARRQFATEFDNEARPPMSNDNESVVLLGDEEKVARSDNTSDEFHAGYVEEIVREEPNVVKIYSETDDDEEENKTLSRVKPSIIASGVILGVTIVVFMAIFVVCRIRQKQRYTYRNTFSRTVFQSPIAAARKLSNSSSLSAVMVNVAATSTTRWPERAEMQETVEEFDSKSDMDNDSLDANDSWETIPDYAK